ncbi:MAG TPA: hypothetical protein VFZ62_02430 [Candidatus Saccharimonadales bacterium]
MPARSNDEVRTRMAHIRAIAAAGAPTDPSRTDRYNAAVRISERYDEAMGAGCFKKARLLGKLFGPVDSFYEMFPDEDPTANK